MVIAVKFSKNISLASYDQREQRERSTNNNKQDENEDVNVVQATMNFNVYVYIFFPSYSLYFFGCKITFYLFEFKKSIQTTIKER